MTYLRLSLLLPFTPLSLLGPCPLARRTKLSLKLVSHAISKASALTEMTSSASDQILLAYLPTSKLEHIPNKAGRRRVLANLFHSCMSKILNPLKTAGLDGIAITSGDGVLRRGHPLFAAYVGDYPEQILVTCCKTGECPQCECHRNEMGDLDEPPAYRNLQKILDAFAAADENTLLFVRACKTAGIKPVYHPFWQDLPYVNPFKSITPDVLHPGIAVNML